MTRRSIFLIIGILAFLLISMMLGVQRATGKWLPFTFGNTDISHVNVARADALDPPPTTHAVFSKLLQKIGIDNPNGEITFDSVFRTSNRNLYSYAYQQIFDKPEKDALLELSQTYGLTPTEAEQVVSGIYTPLINKSAGGGYSQDRAIADMAKIQRSYGRILQYKRLEYDLGATVASTEIFTNGSVDDSSFDLIHDLDIIEQILFIDKAPVQLNQKPFKNPTSKDSPFGTSSAAITPSSTTPPKGTSGSGTTPKDETKTPADTDKPATVEDILKGLTPPSGTINACEKNSPLNKAIDAYDVANGTSSGNINGGSGNSGSIPTPTPSTKPVNDIVPPELQPIITSPAQPPVKLVNSDFCSDIVNTASSITSTKPLKDTTFKSESTLIYSYPEEAPHIFCVSLDTRSREYKTYYKKDTCVQCMVAAMNESMKKLLSKNLTPNKLAGNAYESSKCKSMNLSSLVDINIFTIAVPIITPNKLGPFVGHDLGKEWDRFVKNNLPFGQTKGASDQRSVDEALQNIGSNGTQVELLNEYTTTVKAEIAAASARRSQQPISKQADAKSEGFQQVVQEMRLMTAYFAGFQESFNHINSDACKGLFDKPDTK